MKNRDIWSTTLWVLIAAHLIFVVLSTATGVRLPVPGMTVLLLLALATIHGLRQYSLLTFVVFAAITFVVSNFYENLSIITGFPFGNYYYADSVGTKLFYVPWVVSVSYFSMGYFAWRIAQILLGIFRPAPHGRDVFLLPVIASFVMVMWDMVLDPITATIGQNWVWEDGGSYFGVPFSNYMGWLLCVYTLFQLFALYLVWRPDGKVMPDGLGRAYWYQAIVPFFAFSLTWALQFLDNSDQIVTDPSGQTWHTTHIMVSATLVEIFTVGFVCLLSALLVSRAELKSDQPASFSS